MGLIDTVRIGYRTHAQPARDSLPEGTQAHVDDVGTPGEGWRYHVKLSSGAVLQWGGGGRAVMEWSVPKMLHGHNVEAVGLLDALGCAREVYREAAGVLAPTEAFEACRVYRVDVVRDFSDVPAPLPLLRALQHFPSKGRCVARLYADPARNGAATLTKGNGARGGTLYDKWAEVARTELPKNVLSLAEGRLRYEARIRKRPLEKAHAGTVADLSRDRLETVRREVWEWCGYGTAVAMMDDVEAKIWAAPVSKSARKDLLAFWRAVTTGHDPREVVSRPTIYRCRDWLIAEGALPGDWRTDTDLGTFGGAEAPPIMYERPRPGTAVRLDLGSGRLMREAV